MSDFPTDLMTKTIWVSGMQMRGNPDLYLEFCYVTQTIAIITKEGEKCTTSLVYFPGEVPFVTLTPSQTGKSLYHIKFSTMNQFRDICPSLGDKLVSLPYIIDPPTKIAALSAELTKWLNDLKASGYLSYARWTERIERVAKRLSRLELDVKFNTEQRKQQQQGQGQRQYQYH